MRMLPKLCENIHFATSTFKCSTSHLGELCVYTYATFIISQTAVCQSSHSNQYMSLNPLIEILCENCLEEKQNVNLT